MDKKKLLEICPICGQELGTNELCSNCQSFEEVQRYENLNRKTK